MFWVAARALVGGESPYALPRVVDGFTFQSGYLNPLPAALAVAPLAGLPFRLATVLFNGIGMGVLAFGLSRTGWHRLPILMSFPALYSLIVGQWSSYVTAAALIPGLAWAAVCKPNIGLAALAYRPSPRFAWVAVFTLAVAFVVRPVWVGEWLGTLRTVLPGSKVAPITVPGGILLLAALTRWRRSDGRLLLAMSCIPHTVLFYDELILGLLAETRKQALVFALWSYGAVIVAALIVPRPVGDIGYYRILSLIIVWAYYLPALVVVLRRPNEGDAPAWVERAISYWPAWLRGQRTTS
jgi:hypothetical protein